MYKIIGASWHPGCLHASAAAALHFLIVLRRNLTALRHRDEVLQPVLVPFLQQHHTLFELDNTRPHRTGLCGSGAYPDISLAYLFLICHLLNIQFVQGRDNW